jgi:hypothetical protein
MHKVDGAVRIMNFEQYCQHMYAENCHERREYGQIEYASVEEYMNNGRNLIFLNDSFINKSTEELHEFLESLK